MLSIATSVVWYILRTRCLSVVQYEASPTLHLRADCCRLGIHASRFALLDQNVD